MFGKNHFNFFFQTSLSRTPSRVPQCLPAYLSPVRAVSRRFRFPFARGFDGLISPYANNVSAAAPLLAGDAVVGSGDVKFALGFCLGLAGGVTLAWGFRHWQWKPAATPEEPAPPAVPSVSEIWEASQTLARQLPPVATEENR